MAEPVDTVSLLIAHLLTNGDLDALVAGCIAGAHRFSLADGAEGARGWPDAARALTLSLIGPDGLDTISCPDAATERMRVEYRAWGPTTAEATRVAGWLAHLARSHNGRVLVPLPDGRDALLFVLAVGESPRAETDPDTGYPTLRGVLRVHHQAMA